MKLVYFRGKQPNFGDDLNAVLWPRLLPGLFDETGAEGFLGIGTLIGMATPGCLRLHVFSTGAGYDAVETWRTERRDLVRAGADHRAIAGYRCQPHRWRHPRAGGHGATGRGPDRACDRRHPALAVVALSRLERGMRAWPGSG